MPTIEELFDRVHKEADAYLSAQQRMAAVSATRAHADGVISHATYMGILPTLTDNEATPKQLKAAAQSVLGSFPEGAKLREWFGEDAKRRRRNLANFISPGFTLEREKATLRAAYRIAHALKRIVFPALLGWVAALLVGWSIPLSIVAAILAAIVFGPYLSTTLNDRQRAAVFGESELR